MNYDILRGDLQKDKEDFLEFWKINFPRWPHSKYEWFYEENFYGPAAYWLARDCDDNNCLIGTTVLFPKRFLIDGQPGMIGIGGDFGVEKKHRGHGSAAMITDASFSYIDEAGLAFIYATPNVASEKVATRQGFKIVGRAIRMVKILRSVDYVNRFLKIRPISKIFSMPIDWILKSRSRDSSYRRAENRNFEILDDFDERFDKLWHEAAPDYRLIGERTSAYLHWRFTQCPFKTFKIFALTEKPSDDVLGYVICRTEDRNLIIADFFVLNMDEVIETLLAEFLIYQRKQDIDTVTLFFFGNKKAREKFKAYGFSQRPDNRSIIAYIKDDSPYCDCVLDEDNWYFMEGDNDT